eukprot:Hpha_TRINITY_DN28584_c0_g1::TRINITY_DN28584_c0_g1_i1::g.18555::m.18555
MRGRHMRVIQILSVPLVDAIISTKPVLSGEEPSRDVPLPGAAPRSGGARSLLQTSTCTVLNVYANNKQTCVMAMNGAGAAMRCWGQNTNECYLGIGDATNRGGVAGTMGSQLPFIDTETSFGASSSRQVQSFSLGYRGGCFRSTALGITKCWGSGSNGYNGGETFAH